MPGCTPALAPGEGVTGMRAPLPLLLANLSLLVLFPVTWFVPVLRAGLVTWFGLGEISILSSLQTLWESDPAFALLVTFLAVFAPYAKTISLALLHVGWLDVRALPALHLLGRLAMADMFLIALYVVVVKDAGSVTVETAPGLWLFSVAVIGSILVAHFTEIWMGRRN